MVNALVLYTNGKYKEISLSGLKDYQKIVGGSIQGLPVSRGYVNPSQHYPGAGRPKLWCYVNEEGMMKALPENPWQRLLEVLGASFGQGYPLFGNTVVLSKGKGGKDGSVDPYIVTLAKKYSECKDVDAFFVALEKLNRDDVVSNGRGGLASMKKTSVLPKEEEEKRNNTKRKEPPVVLLQKDEAKKPRTTEKKTCCCEDTVKTETKICVICSCNETQLMNEHFRRATCPLHQTTGVIHFCGIPKFVCAECEEVGWVSLDGTGGGTGQYNAELGLKIVKGKMVAYKK